METYFVEGRRNCDNSELRRACLLVKMATGRLSISATRKRMFDHTYPFHGSDLRTIVLKVLIGLPDCGTQHGFIAVPTFRRRAKIAASLSRRQPGASAQHLDYRTPSEFYAVYKQRAMTLTTVRI